MTEWKNIQAALDNLEMEIERRLHACIAGCLLRGDMDSAMEFTKRLESIQKTQWMCAKENQRASQAKL